jgi:hypothetical protein
VKLKKTKAWAGAGEWEHYKTSNTFDGTAKHPWWLSTASLSQRLRIFNQRHLRRLARADLCPRRAKVAALTSAARRETARTYVPT